MSTGFFVLLASSFGMVSARAFQQLNVMHDRILWVFPTSGVMALLEVTIVLHVVTGGLWSAVPMFLGGSTGCAAAMLMHRHMRKESN